MHISHAISIFLFLVMLGHYAFNYPYLPDVMATHFRGGGRPDRWMSKTGFIVFEVVLLGFIALMKFGLPRLFKNIPVIFVNIPNRKFWLAEERRDKTFEILDREIGWIFVGIMVLVIAVNQLLYQANLSDNPTLSGWFWFVFIGFLAFIAIWMVRFMVIFRLPK